MNDDPDRIITDDEFEQMVEEAEREAECECIRASIGRKRFKRILAFKVPLADISEHELTLHFHYAVLTAR